MNIYIVRHGQTLFNYLERVQGWSDSPLTSLGVEQGKLVAEHLSDISFDKIFSSDLKRAIDTANYIVEEQNTSVTIETTNLLREAYYGSFEGGPETGPWEPVFLEYGYPVEKILTDFDNTLKTVLQEVPNEETRNIIAESDELNLAENYNQYFYRINSFIEELLLSKDEINNVLVVCHGGTAQLLLEILLEDSESITEPDNCSTSIVEVSNQNRLVVFNETLYMDKVNRYK